MNALEKMRERIAREPGGLALDRVYVESAEAGGVIIAVDRPTALMLLELTGVTNSRFDERVIAMHGLPKDPGLSYRVYDRLQRVLGVYPAIQSGVTLEVA